MVLANAKGASRASVFAVKNQANDTLQQRIQQLQKRLNYPLHERDRQGSEFWYLRPGKNADEASETAPIAFAVWDELDSLDANGVSKFFAEKAQKKRIYQNHYLERQLEQQPVLYLLWPSGETGQVAMILPSEGKLTQRSIQVFDVQSQALKTRLDRLAEIPIAERALVFIPQVEYAFYEPIKTAKELAQLLAEAAREIEQVIPAAFAAEAKDGHLHRLFDDVKTRLLEKLEIRPEKEGDYGFSVPLLR